MIVFYLIITIAGVPTGAQYATREACEDAALRVSAAVSNAKVECVERRQK